MSQRICLYWASGSTPCWRVQLALEEKNIPYESKFLSFDKKEHKSEEIMKLNPRGQVDKFKIVKNSFLTINVLIFSCRLFKLMILQSTNQSLLVFI